MTPILRSISAMSLSLVLLTFLLVGCSTFYQAPDPTKIPSLDVDPDYYAPFELAWKYQGKVSGLDLNELGLAFHRHHAPHWVPAGATVSGFVFAKADQGAKAVTVNLMSDKDVKHFDFVVDVPGLRADYLDVDWDGLYAESETRAVDATELRRLLETLPCSVRSAATKRLLETH